MRAPRRTRGFTLVEVMVALLIMAAIAVMSWRGIDGMLRSRDISQASLAHSERLQTVLAQWEQDLRSQQAGGTRHKALSFDGSTLRITRSQPEGLQLVAWTLRNGQLYRWEAPPTTTVAGLDEAWQRSQQDLAQQGRQLLALEGVAEWQVYFYRRNAWSNAQSSDDADTSPSGVRMVLQFAPGQGFGGPLTRQVAVLEATP